MSDEFYFFINKALKKCKIPYSYYIETKHVSGQLCYRKVHFLHCIEGDKRSF